MLALKAVGAARNPLEVWHVVDAGGGSPFMCLSAAHADVKRRVYDIEYPYLAPHRVIHLREVVEELGDGSDPLPDPGITIDGDEYTMEER